MRGFRRRRGLAAAVAIATAVCAAAVGPVAAPASAQILPPGWIGPLGPQPEEPPTTTTPPPSTTPPPTVPGSTAPAPAGAAPTDGDAGVETVPGDGRVVPPDAQVVIDAVERTGPNDNHALVDGVAALEARGFASDDARRAVFGRFPVLGPANWVDDWHFPRWTGSTFRFHLGLDVFAAYGTPVAAPADGVARVGSNPLGGLTVRVVEPDGTTWYLAHLSDVAEGLSDGTPVAVGQLVGFVGDSGNARGGAPHLHLGLYLAGGEAAPPKPSMDAWVAEGAARVAELLEASAPVRRNAAARRSLDLGWARAADEARRFLAPFANPALREATRPLLP